MKKKIASLLGADILLITASVKEVPMPILIAAISLVVLASIVVLFSILGGNFNEG